MKILLKNLKKGEIKVKAENLDDLWIISSILNKEDFVSGKGYRKVSLGDKQSEKANVVKKPIFVKIKVEKVEFDSDLKILGTIEEGPEDIPKASHQSLNIGVGDELKIEKEWLKYQIEKIEEAEIEKSKIIACIFNREEAIFGKLEKNNFSIISRINGKVSKKAEENQGEDNFFKEVVKSINELNERLKPQTIIYASSHFWKSNLESELGNLKEKCVFATVNDVSEVGFSELLKRPELETALKDHQASSDSKIIEEVFTKISKEEPVCYGEKDCTTSGNLGAIEELICTENLIKEKREENSFEDLENLFKVVEKNRGKIHIISGKGTHVNKLDGLGGIAGILRFKV